MKSKFTSLVLILAPLGIFFYALYVLFDLRFDTGDLYPPYSSLRADPLGSKMLYESLYEMPDLEVSRNLQSLVGYPIEEKAAIFYLGHQIATYMWLRQPELRIPSVFKVPLEEIKKNGGRLVISLLPESRVYHPQAEPALPDQVKKYMEHRSQLRKKQPEEPYENKTDEADLLGDWASMTWGVVLRFASLPDEDDAGATPSGSPHENPLTWRTTTYFKTLDPDWKVLYRRGDLPVIIERPWGKGTVVLASDSYFLSNEALILDRHLPLIQHLIGDNNRIIFEETHFAIMQQPGIVGLAREYGLHKALWAILLLAGLFIWKNAVCLVPPVPEEALRAEAAVGGKEASEGFINLLRRNIPASRLMEVCFHEWDSTYARTRRDLKDRRNRMAQALAAAQPKDPLSCYRTLNRILKERE